MWQSTSWKSQYIYIYCLYCSQTWKVGNGFSEDWEWSTLGAFEMPSSYEFSPYIVFKTGLHISFWWSGDVQGISKPAWAILNNNFKAGSSVDRWLLSRIQRCFLSWINMVAVRIISLQCCISQLLSSDCDLSCDKPRQVHLYWPTYTSLLFHSVGKTIPWYKLVSVEVVTLCILFHTEHSLDIKE